MRNFIFIALILLIVGVFGVNRYSSLGLMSIYGIVSILRIGWQILLSRKEKQKVYLNEDYPFTTIVLPSYNEDPETVKASIISLKEQKYPELEVIVIDDGSFNQKEIKKIAKELGVRFIGFEKNKGKRHALAAGFKAADKRSVYIATADSDTIWEPKALRRLVDAVSIGGVGAATGYVAARNKDVNLLTKLIYLRYYMAFEQERAAQSWFGVVTCVSGPLGIYRRDLIDKITDEFVSQKFMGRECTFGDDRHLTNLVLLNGLAVSYSNAKCSTNVPTTVKGYIKQQARWGKSHWREMIWQFKALPLHHWYLTYDWQITLLMPFLLSYSIIHQLFTHNYIGIAYLGFTIILMGLIRSIYPALKEKDWQFLIFPIYGFFHLFVLLPLKFYSLFTINITKWGTR